MKVTFATPPEYQTNCFPENLDQVPRIGDHVSMRGAFFNFYEQKGLPIMLKVVAVVWCELEGENCAIVKLDYYE